MHLSERLIEIVDRLLRDAGTEIAAVGAFAVGVGPGSFTGTRIGVMTAKTLASVLQKPLFGVSSLEAMAAEYAGLRNTVVVPLLPCRVGVVYAAAYTVGGVVPQTVFAPVALPLADLAERCTALPHENLLFCGEGLLLHQDELSAILANAVPRVSFGKFRFPRSAAVAALGWQRWKAGEPGEDALTLVPLYIAPPPISLPKVAFALPKS